MNAPLRQTLACLVLLAIFTCIASLRAEPPADLLPVFGTEGAEFSSKAEKGHVVHGWLPKGWVDNSEWAPITATYTKLDDFPDDAHGAVRIKVEKLDDGQLQLTSFESERTFTKGQPYRVFGWVRSPDRRNVSVTVRQAAEPYEAFFEAEVGSGTKWKPFELNFQPTKDIKAIVMLAVTETGTVDLAGVTVVPGGPGPSLLPVFGTEGAEFSTKGEKGHLVHGWLPTDWDDNSEWAAVTATYRRQDDPPAETLGALEIKVEKVDEGQLQLTSFNGDRTYAKGTTYRVQGWVRSPDKLAIFIGARQSGEPYEMYHEQEVAAGAEWKPFTFTFRPEKEIKALIMFAVKQVGTVDLAGITVSEKMTGK